MESEKKVKSASKAPEKKESKPQTGQSGFTATLRRLSSALVIHRTPEVTRFLVNVVSVVATALRFEHCVRYEKPSHYGHPPNHSYASYFVWAVLNKVYAVGLHTAQLRGFGNNFLPEHTNAVLPATVAALVETLGVFEDHQTKIMLAPRVTVGLLTYLSNIAGLLNQAAYVAEDQPNALDPEDFRGYVQYCYGGALQASVCWRSYALAHGAEVPMPQGTEENHVRLVTALETANAQVAGGAGAAALNVPAAQVALPNGLVTPSFMYDVVAAALVPVPAAGAHPYLTVARRNALVATAAAWVAAPGCPLAPYGQGNNVGACPIATLDFLNIALWFKKVYVTRELTGSYTGSPSSVILSARRGHMTSLSSVVPATAEEMLSGCLWGNRHLILVDAADRVMNLNDPQRNTPPFSTQDFDSTPGKLLTHALSESRLVQGRSE